MRSTFPNFWSACAVQVSGRDMIAVGDSRRIRLWDPLTGENRMLGRPRRPTLALCEVSIGSRRLIASAGQDRLIRLWDPVATREVVQFTAHAATINALRVVRQPAGDWLVSAGDEGVLVVLDLATNSAVRAIAAGGHPIFDLCVLPSDGGRRLATVGVDGVVRILDVDSGEQIHALTGHQGWACAVCPVTVDDRPLIATGGEDFTIRLWDPVTGERVRELRPKENANTWSVTMAGGGTIHALCVVQAGDRTLLAAGGDFPGVWLWDPRTGTGAGWIGWGGMLDNNPTCGWIRKLVIYPHPDGPRLVTCGYDKTVQTFVPSPTPMFTGF